MIEPRIRPRRRIPLRQATGLYVHSSPPTALPVHPSIVRQWLRGGEIERLQDLVLKGEGNSLIGEYSPNSRARAFIYTLPRTLRKIEEIHGAAKTGSIDSVERALRRDPHLNLELSRDSSGLGLLHRAVINGNAQLQEWLLENYPNTIKVLDKEKRNPLHYAAGSEEAWNRLVAAGADVHAADKDGHTPAFYMNHPRKLRPPAPDTTILKRLEQGLVVKPSNIRIWIHDKDLGRLQKVLWEGMGDKLKTETSSQPVVKRFLNAVPYIMGSIRDVHSAAINNDLELLVSKSREPVPKDILLSKDVNGLNPLHKAAGLGNAPVVREILRRVPEAVNSKDNLDRTPLHYAAGLRDQEKLYRLLLDHGADEDLEDKKGNTPSHYRVKPSDLEAPKLLKVVPDAPRTAHIFPPSWDWRLLTSEGAPISAPPSPQIETIQPFPTKSEDEQSLGEEEDMMKTESSFQEPEPGDDIGKDASEDEGVGSELLGTERSSSDHSNEESDLNKTMTLGRGLLSAGLPSVNGIDDSENEENHTEDVLSDHDRDGETGNDSNQINMDKADEDVVEDEGSANQKTEDENPELISTANSSSPTNLDEPKSDDPHQSDSTQNTGFDQIDENEVSQNQIETIGTPEQKETGEEENEDNQIVERAQSAAEERQTATAENDEVEVSNETNEENGPENDISEIPDDAEQIEDIQNSENNEETDLETGENPPLPKTAEVDVQETDNERTETKTTEPDILEIIPAPVEQDSDTDQKAVSEISEGEKEMARKLVESGDMEAMAEMVLNGKGSAFLDIVSDNPDVQLFISNIPQYMAKIEKVHKAARDGDLRGVQTALDRRKFAVARDNSSPIRPTPLHVATLFGRTSVLRYLAGRFPETMHAKDALGRTPLHYAATLPDNGHFYSLLITLGADRGITDNNGLSADDYMKGKGGTRNDLLAEYQKGSLDGAEINFNQYSDRGAELIQGGYPIFNQEDGQYLASSLGEPLIKGLTEVAQIRPTNPVSHLANFLMDYSKSDAPPNKEVLRSIEASEDDIKEDNEEMNDFQRQNQLQETSAASPPRMESAELNGDESAPPIPEIEESSFKPTNRDEHGQSVVHFAAARSHGRNAMYQLLQEIDINVGLRDSLYRTARDVAEQLSIHDNIQSIDKYVVAIAARGENDKLTELLLEGYDHILDAEDGDNIMDVVKERGNESTLDILNGIRAFEEKREKLHRAIRFGSLKQVGEILDEASNDKQLAIGKNLQGRCSLHVAVLTQDEAIVEHIAKNYPAALHIGDNLMRTPLHYAMGVEKVEPLSRLLIASGAQRVLKDLRGRQPSYYFMNKTEVQKLQDEEEALRV